MPDPGGANGRDDHLAAIAMVEAMAPSATRTGTARTLERVCSAAVSSLGLLGATARLVPRSGLGGLCVTAGDTDARLGEIEVDVGEGPGATAFELKRPVLVPDLAGPGGHAWPGYRQTALELGVAAVFVFPIQLGAVALGTLELFASRASALTPAQTRLARTYAELALGVLLDRRLTTEDGELPLGLAHVFDARTSIAQAQGMTMVDLGVGLGEAMARLRAHAFATGIPLSELADKVIGGYVLPRGDNGAGGD